MSKEFRGLRGNSEILRKRQQQEIEKNIIGKMENVVESSRRYILNLYREGKHPGDHELESEINRHLMQEYPNLVYNDRMHIACQIKNELTGYGPLQNLIDDPDITDIVVINEDRVLYEKHNLLQIADIRFHSASHLMLFIERLCYLGKSKIDESNPKVSLTLPGGYRVAITIPPLCEKPNIAIRKFTYVNNIDELIKNKTFSQKAAQFLKLCIPGRRNMVFCGPMGSGKTTMIAVLGYELDPMELPVLVEEVRECPLEHPNLRIFVARPPNIEGKGEIKFDQLLKHSLQSRGTRILVAEVRDRSVYYMLQAMAMGQDGSIGTLHADNAQDAAHVRVPMMLAQAPETANMKPDGLNRIIGAALHIIVQMDRTPDGKRVCSQISEVLKSDGEPPEVRDIFVRKNGDLIPTGYIPQRALEGMGKYGIKVPEYLFY
ncbi:MAG: CpaF family protein [Firmicutes bacterium]|nr:CpaF family protein [Bacillota bacterium]